MAKYIIGVDGGGSKCKASLYRLSATQQTSHLGDDASPIASIVTGPANVFSSFDLAASSIMSAATQLCERQNIKLAQCILSAGCAGGGMSAAQTKFKLWQHPFAKAYLLSDVEASCISANAQKPCALIIIGTGSCLALYHPDEFSTLGGHGMLLGDIAGGAWLGKQVLTWYLQFLDGLEDSDPLSEAMAQHLGRDANAVVERFSHDCAKQLASCAHYVFEQRVSSPVCQAILHQSTRYISALINKAREHSEAVFIDGGLASSYLPLLNGQRSDSLKRPFKSAEHGAFLHGSKMYRMETEK
ncbi:BadF/BadG/BcrA/BcrD ATPase family protein [Ningiella sp. W23]|uniref:BadF/BadG/BcrA/BcrD ATPase family protein n=1 Tax=Ningiella sp. W23 TaxID=3023715 RepID=UPI003757AAFE